MDDEVIYSWCFNSLKCFDLTSSIARIILVENSESLLSFRSQQYARQKRREERKERREERLEEKKGNTKFLGGLE